MKTKYIYDLRDASDAGLHGHPETEIKYRWPAATNLTPESLFDCWTFEHEPLPKPLPSFLREPFKVPYGLPQVWKPYKS